MTRAYGALGDPEHSEPPVASLGRDAPTPRIARYAYRSFDRQLCLADGRLGDFLRPTLWGTLSSRQLFLTSLLTGLLGEGPAATMTNLVPDLDHFRGSYGAKHVVPLWRDAACEHPNVTAGLLDLLAGRLGSVVTPESLLAYCYALLSAPSYTARFLEELEVPGPRVPVTEDAALFARAVALGRRLVWLHTFGERFVPDGERAGRVPQGSARYVRAVSQTAEGYPERHAYDPAAGELHVGDGVFAPVAPEVRAFSVSGLDVIGSWLDYRMKEGAGRRSSALDGIRPRIWPDEYSTQLLDLLSVVEHTVAMGPGLDAALDAIASGRAIPAADLPVPSRDERLAPAGRY